MIEERRYGTNPLIETRIESEAMVDKKIRYTQIIEILSESKSPMSAKEIAVEMHNRGYAGTTERNLSAPRITELLNKDILECVGKKKCEYTGHPVGVFMLKEVIKNG